MSLLILRGHFISRQQDLLYVFSFVRSICKFISSIELVPDEYIMQSHDRKLKVPRSMIAIRVQ